MVDDLDAATFTVHLLLWSDSPMVDVGPEFDGKATEVHQRKIRLLTIQSSMKSKLIHTLKY